MLGELAMGRRQGAESNEEVPCAVMMGAIKLALPSGMPSTAGSASLQRPVFFAFFAALAPIEVSLVRHCSLV